jgi:ribosomal protein L7Ae-like RNA K-turn-binding protein
MDMLQCCYVVKMAKKSRSERLAAVTATASAATGSGAVSKKKAWGARNVLHSPFATTFPPALAGAADAACTALRAAFPAAPLRRRPRSAKNERTAAPILAPDALPSSKTDEPVVVTDDGDNGNDGDDVDDDDDQILPAPPTPDRPACLHVGMNEVTKALERGGLRVVVVARDVSPAILIAHLPTLCYLRDASLVPVGGGGGDIARALGIKRALAVGIACPESVAEGPECGRLCKLVADLLPFAATLDFPWLAAAKRVSKPPPVDEPILAPRNKV